ncbi:hypothetical protein B0H11DRAFT_1919891 [Mycena galericulata]|nr:hypothetical protein B0H11DRAFT_1919891 [Mycena galericulata]
MPSRIEYLTRAGGRRLDARGRSASESLPASMIRVYAQLAPTRAPTRRSPERELWRAQWIRIPEAHPVSREFATPGGVGTHRRANVNARLSSAYTFPIPRSRHGRDATRAASTSSAEDVFDGAGEGAGYSAVRSGRNTGGRGGQSEMPNVSDYIEVRMSPAWEAQARSWLAVTSQVHSQTHAEFGAALRHGVVLNYPKDLVDEVARHDAELWKRHVNDKTPGFAKSLTDSKIELPNVTTLFILTEASVLQIKKIRSNTVHIRPRHKRTKPADAQNSAPRRGAKLVNGDQHIILEHFICASFSLPLFLCPYLRHSTLLAPAHDVLLDLLSDPTQSAVNSNLRTVKAAYPGRRQERRASFKEEDAVNLVRESKDLRVFPGRWAWCRCWQRSGGARAGGAHQRYKIDYPSTCRLLLYPRANRPPSELATSNILDISTGTKLLSRCIVNCDNGTSPAEISELKVVRNARVDKVGPYGRISVYFPERNIIEGGCGHLEYIVSDLLSSQTYSEAKMYRQLTLSFALNDAKHVSETFIHLHWSPSVDGEA